MKSTILSILIILLAFACNSPELHQDKESSTPSNTLIPKEEYLPVPDGCSQKIMSFKLVEQMSLKNYLFKNGKIPDDELNQKVILYFQDEPTEDQKKELQNQSVNCNWELWTPQTSNHPLGYIPAEISINNFKEVMCLDFVQKITTAEDVIDPNYLEKLNGLK